jgi:polyisoprenoid-binding protein YceI
MLARHSFVVAAAVLSLSTVAAAAPRKFENDGNHTRLGFKAQTTLFDVEGQFNAYNLNIQGDPDAPDGATVKIEIEAKSIDTANKTRDNHLRSDDFFDVKKTPKITFTSDSVRADGDKVVVAGTLEMHGIKKPLTITFSHVVAKNGAGYMEHVYKAEVPINRNDFGIGSSSVAARISLADTVTMKILIAGFFG